MRQYISNLASQKSRKQGFYISENMLELHAKPWTPKRRSMSPFLHQEKSSKAHPADLEVFANVHKSTKVE